MYTYNVYLENENTPIKIFADELNDAKNYAYYKFTDIVSIEKSI